MAGLLHQVTVIGLLSLFYQGMEEVKRQFGKHIAVEPEWEAGFTLQIQLRHILAMFQDWCSSDVRSLAIYLLKNRVVPERWEVWIAVINYCLFAPSGWDLAACI